jgi:hypothetical protein
MAVSGESMTDGFAEESHGLDAKSLPLSWRRISPAQLRNDACPGPCQGSVPASRAAQDPSLAARRAEFRHLKQLCAEIESTTTEMRRLVTSFHLGSSAVATSLRHRSTSCCAHLRRC